MLEKFFFLDDFCKNYPNIYVVGNLPYYITSPIIEHLINNIIVLFAAGRYCEQALGHIKFSAMYVVSGVLGSILSYVMMIVRNDYAVSAGASGAIFGVFGALLWVVIINKGRFEEFDGKGIFFMIALALYFGISSGAADNWGHIGGLISGFIFAVIFYHKCQDKTYV